MERIVTELPLLKAAAIFLHPVRQIVEQRIRAIGGHVWMRGEIGCAIEQSSFLQ